MSTTTASCIHEMFTYGTDEELLETAVPFVAGALEAGEPAVVTLSEATAAILQSELGIDGDIGGPVYNMAEEVYRRPASSISILKSLLEDHLAQGAHRVRVLGNLPPSAWSQWRPWARYEATVNHVFEEFPLWAICAYDTRVMHEEALAEMVLAHPFVTEPGADRRTNERFVDPGEFMLARRRSIADPLEAAAPLVEVHNPTQPREIRQALQGLAENLGHGGALVDDLLLAVTEVTTNALVHGGDPVTLRAWADEDRVVCTVTDSGAGPSDPFAGLTPVSGVEAGGLGLWIANQLCDRVDLDIDYEAGTCTVRLVLNAGPS